MEILEQFNEFAISENNNISSVQSKNYNSLVFAYIGDAVFSLFVRNYFASKDNSKAGILNTKTNKLVRASAQAKAYDYILDKLNEEEDRVSRSARNIRTNNVAKNSNLIEYKKATAFEAVLGYLYMTKNITRLNEILNLSIEFLINENNSQ